MSWGEMMRDFLEVLNERIDGEITSGKIIKAFRKSLLLTQNDLAQITHIDPSRIGSLETGKINISIHYAEKIASALGIRPFTLLYPDGEFHKTTEHMEIEKKAKTLIEKKRKNPMRPYKKKNQ